MESAIDSSVLPGASTGDTSLPGFPAEDPSDVLYHKLPTPISFRLIEITTVFPYLSCKMITVSLDNHAPYHALSYCWGSPNRSVTLRCNGFKLKISSNLAEGLKRLHVYAVEERSMSFWVDQICINQEDNAERTQQVRMMRSIYQRSTRAIIWLPLRNKIAESAKSILADITHYLYSDGARLPPIDDTRWGDLAQLLESPWFERCWILQEIAVSRKCPEILCGNQRLSWSHFEEVIVWLNKSGHKHRTERMELVNSIREVIGKQGWNIAWEDTVSHLDVLLRLTNSFCSTDPRDKVFALLGLSSATRFPKSWPEELIPDYTRPVQDVYAAAAKYCIRQTDSLSILSQFVHDKTRGDSSPHPQFPSWIPRWDLADSTRRISAFDLYWGPHRIRTLIEKLNKASTGTRVTMDQNAPLSILRIRGMQVDTISICLLTAKLDDTKFHAGVPERHEDYLSKLTSQLYGMSKEHVRRSTRSFNRTFFQVTTAGLTPEHKDVRYEPLDAFESIINLSEEQARPRTPDGSFTLIDDRGYAALEGQSINRYIASLQRLMNRRLFVTLSGHLGLGPAGMMSGDTVAILFGGNVPYILRPLENKQWHFVGECYLDGYMDGEAMEGRDPSKDEWFGMV